MVGWLQRISELILTIRFQSQFSVLFFLVWLSSFLFFDFQMVHIGGATKPYSIHSQWLFSWTHEKRFKSRIWNWILVFTLLFLLYYAASDINSPVFVEQLIGWSPLVLFIPSLLHLGPDNNRVTGHHLQYNCFCLTFGYRKTSLNLLSLSIEYSQSNSDFYWNIFFSLLIDMKHFWISTLIFVFTKCERGWMGVGWVHPRRMWRGEREHVVEMMIHQVSDSLCISQHCSINFHFTSS